MAEADGVLQLKLDVFVPLKYGGPTVSAKEWLLRWCTAISESACIPAAISHLPAIFACRLLQGLQEWKRSASAALVFQVLHSMDETILQPFKPDAERLPREHVQPDCTAAEHFRSRRSFAPAPLLTLFKAVPGSAMLTYLHTVAKVQRLSQTNLLEMVRW